MINTDLQTGNLLFYLADFSVWYCSDSKVGSHLPSVEKPSDEAAVPVTAALQSWPTEGAKAQQLFTSPPHLTLHAVVTPWEGLWQVCDPLPWHQSRWKELFKSWACYTEEDRVSVVIRASLPMSHCAYVVSCFPECWHECYHRDFPNETTTFIFSSVWSQECLL